MRTKMGFRVALVAGVLVALAVGAIFGGTVIAQSLEQQEGRVVRRGEEGVMTQTHTGENGGNIRVTRAVADAGTPVTLSNNVGAWLSFPPTAVTSVPVAAGRSMLIIATFTAESACSTTSTTATAGWCSIRILIGGVEGAPAAGLDFAFNSHDLADETSASWDSHSVTRWLRYTNTSAVTQSVPILVQGANTAETVVHRVDDWSLIVLGANT